MHVLPNVFRSGALVSESYLRIGDDAGLAGDEQTAALRADVLLVPVASWGTPALLSRVPTNETAQRVGVFIQPADVDDDVLPKLLDAPVVAIDFPKFTDGRGYSVARSLRDRLGYSGELLATGDVLIDQIPLMVRCGFDAFSISHGPTVSALKSGAFKGLDHIYQAPDAGRQWQRRARSSDFAAVAGEPV
ncbi:MAG: DUF934 domain-containing protein [Pseudomonadota bacterium]